MRKKWFFGILAVLAIFFGAVIFRANSWKQIPYSPKDGMLMFGAIEEKFSGATSWSLFSAIPPGPTGRHSPLDRLATNLRGINSDKEKACVGVIKFRGKLEPPFIHQINMLFHIYPEVNFAHSVVASSNSCTADCRFSMGSSSWGESGGVVDNMKAVRKEFGLIEDNGHVSVNQDFVYIQVGKELRLYPLTDVPPRAKAVGVMILKNTSDTLNANVAELNKVIR